jgi:hypothetical protein
MPHISLLLYLPAHRAASHTSDKLGAGDLAPISAQRLGWYEKN